MRLSIIIPTYNRSALLVKTLNSVLSQTRPPDEIIVVDDGSTDNTRAAMAEYGDRITYHYQTNAYLGAARNTGQAIATGDALCFLDSDDLLLPGALAALERALIAAPEACLSYCRCQKIDENDTITELLWRSHLYREKYANDPWRQLLRGQFLLSTGCALIRRSHLDKLEPWDVTLRGVEDWDMFLRLAESGPFACVNRPLFQYRQHGGNMSSGYAAMHKSILNLYAKHLERHAANAERFRLLEKARKRYVRHGATEYRVHVLLSQAYAARRRNDPDRALQTALTAARLRPNLLLNTGFTRFLAGTWKRANPSLKERIAL